MPEPAPQPSDPERKPSQPPTDSAPRGPDAPPEASAKGALFHTLTEAGFDPSTAYTAEKQLQTMTSEIAGDRLQPVLAELRQFRAEIRENMATKADLAETEANLRREIADRDARLVKWMFGALMAQGAFIIAVVKLLP